MGARPLASLSSGLLARPGHAKPAMRPQVFAPQVHDDLPLEDLGWNDMGQADTAQPDPVPPEPLPPVLIERAELVRSLPRAGRSAPAPASAGRRAAFTVRLDPARHLRLRLASAVAGRSSQQLVVAAIDAFIDSQPQVETLARQVPQAGPAQIPAEKSK